MWTSPKKAWTTWWSGVNFDVATSMGNPAAHGVVSQALQGPSSGACNSAANITGADVAAVAVPLPVWDGVWTDSIASDGYGGQLRLCSRKAVVNGVPSVIVEGVYSEVGMLRLLGVPSHGTAAIFYLHARPHAHLPCAIV